MKLFMKLLAATTLLVVGLTAAVHATGPHWTALGPEGGNVDVVVTDPTNALVIYADSLGGIRKSTDGGATWSDASVGLERRPEVWTLSIDPSNPNRLSSGCWGGSFSSNVKKNDSCGFKAKSD